MAKPFPNQEMIKKVKQYRKKGLSFRQIARVLNKDVKNVYIWYKHSVGNLSTGSNLTVGRQGIN